MIETTTNSTDTSETTYISIIILVCHNIKR